MIGRRKKLTDRLGELAVLIIISAILFMGIGVNLGRMLSYAV